MTQKKSKRITWIDNDLKENVCSLANDGDLLFKDWKNWSHQKRFMALLQLHKTLEEKLVFIESVLNIRASFPDWDELNSVKKLSMIKREWGAADKNAVEKTLYIKANKLIYAVVLPGEVLDLLAPNIFTVDLDSNLDDPEGKIGFHHGNMFPDIVREWLNLDELNDGNVHLELLVPISFVKEMKQPSA